MRQNILPLESLFDSANFELKNQKVKIKYLANHYYLPVVVSEKEKVDYLNHIIDVESEIKFIEQFEEYLKKEFAAKLGRAGQSAKGGIEKLEIVQSERKGRFFARGGQVRRAEGGFGGNSAHPTNFGRNLFEFFRTNTTQNK
ncbi:MAG: hypothetical protein ACYDIA_22010 [Candidatus Humimicrobiaceae bacterium]